MGQINVIVHLQDYQKFGDLWYPTKTVQEMKDIPGVGDGIQTWTYGSLKFGVEINDIAFEQPPEFKKLLVD